MENLNIFDDLFGTPNKKKTSYNDMDYFFDTCSSDELVEYMIDTSND